MATKKKTKATIKLIDTENGVPMFSELDRHTRNIHRLEKEDSGKIEEIEDTEETPEDTPTVPPNPNDESTDTPSTNEDDVPDICKITPLEAYMSTNLNSKIHDYEDLTTRMLNMLGYPSVSIPDIHIDQIHEAITMACEMFTRYAGHTLETLVFDSRLYTPGRGIHLGKLYTVASIQATHERDANEDWIQRGPDHNLVADSDVYVTRVNIPKKAYYVSPKDFEILSENCKNADKDLLCYLRDVSIQYPCGIEELSVISGTLYNFLILKRGYKPEQFKKSKDKVVTEQGKRVTIYWEDEQLGRQRDPLFYSKTYDYDLCDYRRVKSVISFNEMRNMSPIALFGGDISLVEQSYFAWEFNNRGFSLLERHCLGEWMDARNKIYALERRWSFDPYTQYLTIIPQPRPQYPMTAVIEAYVERPLRDIIKDPWVFKYALAHVKTIIGNIRGRWGDVQLAGGGVISGNRMTQEGNDEIKTLEQMLIEKGGYGSVQPAVFFVG